MALFKSKADELRTIFGATGGIWGIAWGLAVADPRAKVGSAIVGAVIAGSSGLAVGHTIGSICDHFFPPDNNNKQKNLGAKIESTIENLGDLADNLHLPKRVNSKAKQSAAV